MQIAFLNQIKAIEKTLTRDYGIPMILLMDQAGAAVALRVKEYLKRTCNKKAVIVCGTGHNGGDGLAAARYLASAEIPITVYVNGEVQEACGLTQFYGKLLRKMDVEIKNLQDAAVFSDFKDDIITCTVIVDALIGIGYKPPMQSDLSDIIGLINQSDSYVISVDIPSGVDCDTGQVESAVQAEETIAMIMPKPAHYLYPGAGYCGKLFHDELCIPKKILLEYNMLHASDFEEIFNLVSVRRKDSHKGDQGKLLVIAGSDDYPGAAVLTAKGAVRSGAGLVYLADFSKDMRYNLIPEVLPVSVNSRGETGAKVLGSEWVNSTIAQIGGVDAVVVGPGLTSKPDIVEAVREIAIASETPLILDADALNAFVGYSDLLKKINVPLILTPHPGELGRLTGKKVKTIQQDRVRSAVEAAVDWGCTVVLKGAGTVTALSNGRAFINTTGNPGMAVGGSGDVLSGLVGGLACQGYSCETAGILGPYIHGAAGDRAASLLGPVGYTPSELSDCFPLIFKDLNQKE